MNQADSEQILKELNQLLMPVGEKLDSQWSEPQYPLVFIVGTPRSGTTLMSQLLADWGGFGYINNFIARFWLAPSVGVMIASALGLTANTSRSSYFSEDGVTVGWTEPHEFGYFWNRWFALGQETHKLSPDELLRVDRSGLQRAVAAIEAMYGVPMVFKNNTWCTMQIDFLADLFPRAIFVACSRDPVFNAQSLVLMRERKCGDRTKWWSVRPPQYGLLLQRPWWEQVAGQVYYITRDMENQLSKLPRQRVVRAKYEKVCSDPYVVVREIVCRVNELGADITREGFALQRLKDTNIQKLEHESFALLVAACAAVEEGGIA